jgi:hypothetical protein
MKPYGVGKKDRFKSKCPCCNYDKYFGRMKARKKRARQQLKKECFQ